jgi:hypothetical protein
MATVASTASRASFLHRTGLTPLSLISTEAASLSLDLGEQKWRVLAHVCPECRENLHPKFLRARRFLDVATCLQKSGGLDILAA